MNGLVIGFKKLIMRRYWISKNDISADRTVQFQGDLFHHIFGVCRQEKGHHFEVLTGESIAYLIEVLDVGKKTAVGRIIEERQIAPLKKPYIRIALSVSRYPVMDSIMERAVEMGVAEIVPFVSQYSFVRKIKEIPEAKIERWNKIIISATQQSGRGELMKLANPLTMEELIQQINRDPTAECLFAYEGHTEKSIQDRLKEIKTKCSEGQPPVDHLWLVVGSEGGFSTQEVEAMKNLGLHPVTLGQQILRVETACLTLVAALKYEFGLMNI